MENLGEYLKTERLKQGLSLQNVFEKTRISIGVLQDLENGNYERIGTPLLVRNFIRTYCSVLGIDHESLLEKHEDAILSCDRQDEGIHSYRRFSAHAVSGRRKWVIAVVLMVMVAAGIAVGGWLVKNRSTSFISHSVTKSMIPQQELPADLPKSEVDTESAAEKSPSGTQAEQVEAPLPENESVLVIADIKDATVLSDDESRIETPVPLEEDALKEREPANQEELQVAVDEQEKTALQPEEKPVPQAAGHSLEAEADQEVWVQVVLDGKTTRNVLMKPGDKKEWEVEKFVNIVLGNAGGVRLKWDGKPLRSLGKSGEVVRFRLPDPKYFEES